MAFLMSAVDVTAPSGLWEWLIIDVFGFIGKYGWRIVVLVVFLKLILSPLDFYQKYKMRKNQRITESLKPQMDKLAKQYGEDKQALQQKQMELQKKAGFSYMSACIPMIVTLVLFITFYTALRSVSAYMEFRQYVEMHNSYVTAYNESGFDYIVRTNGGMDYALSADGVDFDDIDAWLSDVYESNDKLSAKIDTTELKGQFDYVTVIDPASTLLRYKTEYIDQNKSYSDFVADYAGRSITELSEEDGDFILSMSILMQARAQEATVEAFEQKRTQFVWIKSLWVADVPWANSLPEWDTFESSMSKNGYLVSDINANPSEVYRDNENLYNDLIKESTYNMVTASVRSDDKLYKTNGYLIMVVLVVGLSLLSQFITQRQQKKAGQITDGQNMGMMKAMLWMMPIMLAVFALTSSSAFTVYMVANSLMTLMINFITTFIVNLTDGTYRKNEVQVIKHGRADPNDKINKK